MSQWKNYEALQEELMGVFQTGGPQYTVTNIPLTISLNLKKWLLTRTCFPHIEKKKKKIKGRF